jgi:hypothetical protein
VLTNTTGNTKSLLATTNLLFKALLLIKHVFPNVINQLYAFGHDTWQLAYSRSSDNDPSLTHVAYNSTIET